MQKNLNFLIFILLHCHFIRPISSKYVEGHLKTVNDWAFLARFCFFSGRGRYEYVIEYEKRFGDLQLLLYYDDESQWPSIYKTSKSCREKLNVLSEKDNQIVTLSTKSPFNLYSGCILKSNTSKASGSSQKSKNSRTVTNKKASKVSTAYPVESTYFNKFLQQNQDFLSTKPNEIILSTTKEDNFLNSTGQLALNTTESNEIEEIFSENYTPEDHTRKRRNISSFPKLFETENTVAVLISCHNIGGFTSSRERWWYIAIANCGSRKGLDVRYKFRMTNGAPGDFWHEHFSADETYIPPILFSGAIAYSLLLIAVFFCGVELKTLHLYHCTYRLFVFSTLSHWAGMLLDAVVWTKYALTGLQPNRILGGMFSGTSEISFLLLLLLMAKGYTITKARLSTCSTIKLTVFINFYVIFYISLYIYQSEAFDPGEVLNLYESPAGLCLAALRCVAWLAFICSTSATIRSNPNKTAFFYPFAIFGTFWLLGGPIVIIVGVSLLDAWVRESVMYGALNLTAFGGHISFLWLTWPSRANKSFPFHVRTNHIGVMIDTEADEINYPAHTYAPEYSEEAQPDLSRLAKDVLSSTVIENTNRTDQYSYISFPLALRKETQGELPKGEICHLSNNSPDLMSENQNDSGHPSLSSSNRSTPPVPDRMETQREESEMKTTENILAPKVRQTLVSNPFLATNYSSTMTLQPIETPLYFNLKNNLPNQETDSILQPMPSNAFRIKTTLNKAS